MYWTWFKIFSWQIFFPISIEKILSCSRSKSEIFDRLSPIAKSFYICDRLFFFFLKAIKWKINFSPNIKTQASWLLPSPLRGSILAPFIVFSGDGAGNSFEKLCSFFFGSIMPWIWFQADRDYSCATCS